MRKQSVTASLGIQVVQVGVSAEDAVPSDLYLDGVRGGSGRRTHGGPSSRDTDGRSATLSAAPAAHGP